MLTALTFFMMTGTLMLVLATRSRATARAFSGAANAASTGSVQSRAILDDALMFLVRGRRNETGLPTSSGTMPLWLSGQSLLEDRYGIDTITGTSAAPVKLTDGIFTNYAPVLTAEIQAQSLMPAPTHICDLNGRILTFKPVAGDGDVVSFRILRTAKKGQSITAYLGNVPSNRAITLPKLPSAIVINGREFFPGDTTPNPNNEAFDALTSGTSGIPYDAYLASLPLQDSRPITSGTIRASFAGAVDLASLSTDINGDGFADGCDNDNDGVPDSVWITGVVPDQPSPHGGVLKHDLAFLVLDLDGRVNLNAAGSLTPLVTGSAEWPATTTTSTNSGNEFNVTISQVPAGLGYGPADIAAGRLLATGTYGQGAPGFPGRWSAICQSGTVAGGGANVIQRRPSPVVGGPSEGRYGPADQSGRWVPGKSNSMLDPQAICSLQGRSLTDLNVRVKMFTGPELTGVPSLCVYTPDRTKNDFVESPYDFRLDRDAPRDLKLRQSGLTKPLASASGTIPQGTNSVFAVAELERVLRQFDADASNLPPRLAVLLDEFTERSRMTVTTDSWDTPAMAGDAMLKVRNFMRLFAEPTSPSPAIGGANAATVYDIMSPDVSAGLRFDINRPLDHPQVIGTLTPALKQRYCRHLYSLLVALGLPASKDTAQWVANVCDFRDPDSTMTRFEYDTDLTDDRWDRVDSVFGAERPELIITETKAWNGNLSVVLYHPWEAKIVDKNSNNDHKVSATEQIDPNLAPANPNAQTQNSLDLTRKVNNDSVWRLRVDGGMTLALGNITGGGASKLVLDPNRYLCVETTSGGGGGVSSLADKTFVPVAVGEGRVILERLADPAKRHNPTPTNADYNPYVTVDVAPLSVALDQASALKKRRKQQNFWSNGPSNWEDVAGVPDVYPARAAWMHWPNRPFIGVAELALVPMGDANGMLAAAGTASPVLDTTDPAKKLILDAVHVPSRFTGSSLQIGGTNAALLKNVATYEEVCTTLLPRWREPGRVNVNTIVSNTGNTTQALLDNAVWHATVGQAAGSINGGVSPFVSGTKAADSLAAMFALGGNGIFVETPAAPRDMNPFFAYATAIRLGNVATIRSNVFAVWVTLRVRDTSAAGPSPVYRRMFAIVDRSVPVGFNKGENLNARDTIRLQRFLD